MPRPRRCRRIASEPSICAFKPVGVRECELDEAILTMDEFEALRLKDFERMDQEEAAKMMGISQPTFNRIINCARGKISDALVNCKMIRIEGGDYEVIGRRGGCHRRGRQ
ncbi:MAG: DUF134 domain-containing protein [Candidatus Altiarchaeales archaeon]|nr:DUF134 domain-containing protein [Candidatus Altiarchaeota archaeon]MCG2782086.1 DUF134 domain-containing protein [Candidatus Altiarchaeales archaeon]MBU4265625.1 DUF134 domain-containing protein [Candidatus Altiarchaeota archaeon]MBU4341042.1 DUF134 domain-containing protein [Candidatus Altiarchaeota archaeon]MBU4406210.1 DUF134 domain-containing protein [Candidatus Altiarchaeota archaeon]